MGLDLGLKGLEGLAGLSVWQVLRLRDSQSARVPSLRMTNLEWVEESGRAKRAMPTLAMMKPSRTWGTQIVPPPRDGIVPTLRMGLCRLWGG